ncbi:MAG: AmmeMemoRadiSam system radical SAM enzyme [Bacteroidales bacterium]|nr:AmmeMemoRadiSam system radical SAM enzyme [Bacteroidales bacterium]
MSFYPSKDILSIGSIGCNFACDFCQNCEISQANIQEYTHLRELSKEYITDLLEAEENTVGLAFTYNEPAIWIETVTEYAETVRAAGFKTVMVTNGYMHEKAIHGFCRVIDAFNVDLKSFSERFYKKITGGSLQPVLNNLKSIKRFGSHLELTNLIVPGENSDEREFKEMVHWISHELGPDTVLHISRYFPKHLRQSEATDESLLESLFYIANEQLSYVYLANSNNRVGRDTFCPSCNNQAIHRSGYYTIMVGLSEQGTCINCNHKIIKHL